MNNFLSALRLTAVCAFLFCGVYVFLLLAAAKFSTDNGKGLLVMQNEKKFYLLVGQSFTSLKYFFARPSAVNFDAASSGGSNYGTNNPTHIAEVKKRADDFLKIHPHLAPQQIPSEMLTASGSGLDPHISVEAAKIQIKRIAQERKLTEKTLLQIIEKHTEKPLFNLFGTEKVNVLLLNLELDALR
jgi:K+-transporting ATPase ATPase C chain